MVQSQPANSSRDPISKKKNHTEKQRAGGVSQGEGPKFKSNTKKKPDINKMCKYI
jgi:hypothetical protein